MSARFFFIVALAAAVGCASSGTGAGQTRSGPLTAEEIAAYNTDVNSAYDAVARLRPQWLIARGVRSRLGDSDSTEYAYIYVDGRPSGKLSTLRDVPAYQVAELRYYDVAQAQAKFGVLGSKSGVIAVTLKNPLREE